MALRRYTRESLKLFDIAPKSPDADNDGKVDIYEIYKNKPELIENAKYITRKLKAAGYSKAGAQAILANIKKESNFKPVDIEKRIDYATSYEIGGKGGFGILQWTGQKNAKGKLRRRGQLELAANFNTAVRDTLQFQTDYLIAETSGSYSSVDASLKTADDPVVAMFDFLHYNVRSAAAINIVNFIDKNRDEKGNLILLDEDLKERVQKRIDYLWQVQPIVDEIYDGIDTTPENPITGTLPDPTTPENPITGTLPDPPTPDNQNTVQTNDPDTVNEQSNTIQASGEIPAREQEPIYTRDSFVAPTAAHIKKTLTSFIAFKLKDLQKKDTGVFYNDSLLEWWVPLYVILDIYNNYISLLDDTKDNSKGTETPGRKLTEFYTGKQDQDLTKRQYDKKAKFLTNDYHFSIDPMKCILPKAPKNLTLYDSKGNPVSWSVEGSPTIGLSYPAGLVYKNGFHKNIASAFERGLIRGEYDDILNILVSTQFIQDELDKIVKQDEDPDQNENNDMVTFMRTILKGMSDAMGSINDLDLFYDEGDDLFYIVDRKATPSVPGVLPKISLAGVRSTISKLDISSKISSNIASMVSIAAQGTGGHTKDNIGPLLEWNRGLLDRHIIHKSQKSPDDSAKGETRESAEDARLKKWTVDYYEYWKEFNGSNFLDSGDYAEAAVANIKGYHKEFCQKYVVEKISKNPNAPIPIPGVIPVELSFTMMGIGGLKIGQAFLIDEGLLPQQYTDNFGFIITGLSHNISDGKWTTDVKTQFYSTRKPTKKEVDEHERKTKVEVTPFVPPDDTSNIPDNTATEGTIPSTPPINGENASYDTIRAAVIAKGYQWDDREYAINLVGIRNYNSFSNGTMPVSNKFDDIMTISWKENGVKKAEKFACTTDPGQTQVSNYKAKDVPGVAILKEGQYINAYAIGKHKLDPPNYTAFRQVGEVTVWRDGNRDRTYEFVNPQPGLFGINIHRASPYKEGSEKVDNWSAGCQVLQFDSSLSRMLQLARQAQSKIEQKRYTYTLINSTDINLN